MPLWIALLLCAGALAILAAIGSVLAETDEIEDRKNDERKWD